jgi:hypothetical protein
MAVVDPASAAAGARAIPIAELKPSGPAAAAFISASIGLLAVALSHLAAEASPGTKDAIHGLGKLWIPGAQGIGPYSGKETIGLVFWLGSWIVAHFLLRRKNVSLTAYGVLFLALIGIATTILWPPVTHILLGKG